MPKPRDRKARRGFMRRRLSSPGKTWISFIAATTVLIAFVTFALVVYIGTIRTVVTKATEPAVVRPAQASTTAPTIVASSSPTSLVCRNSTDPSCGPFEWVPPPAAKAPISIEIEVLTQAPKAGEPVAFDVHAQHPQEAIDPECGGGDYGDGLADPHNCRAGVCLPRFGPWDTPAPNPGDLQKTFQHTYSAPGVYTVSFSFVTVPSVCGSPYESQGSASVAVTVS
jgi:hypothetical protein